MLPKKLKKYALDLFISVVQYPHKILIQWLDNPFEVLFHHFFSKCLV